MDATVPSRSTPHPVEQAADEPTSTHEPLRVGIVGYGLAGRIFHAPHVRAAGHEVTHVVTSSPERAEQARSDIPGVTVVPDLEGLLARAGELDLVVVATPPHLHHEQAHAVLDAGVSCLVDKPFVVDPADGHELIALAVERRVVLACFQNRRYDDDFRLVRDVVRSGVLGQVYRFESRIERWKPVQSKAWKAEGGVEDGAGLLFDLGSHLVDQAVQLFGDVADAYAQIDRRSGSTAADDDTTVVLTHRGGVRSHLVMSTVTGVPGPRMTVVGEDGTLVVATPDRQEECLARGERPGDPGYAERGAGEQPRLVVRGEPAQCPPLRPGGYTDLYRELAAHLHGEGPNPLDPSASLAVVSLVRDLHERFPLR